MSSRANTLCDPREREIDARQPRPDLAFVCAINEDMGQFGGVVMVLNGECANLVRDYDAEYNPRSHARDVRRLLKRWYTFLTEGQEIHTDNLRTFVHR